ncbi:unnamed protein product [Bursaphelenchus xylophilus]|uniref:(pine wood nematode) hypothetical protein n=1 Tax=Bursaphelenchus xylophilus TaxID=6326 RepID=A0A1I7RM33_BURXY|nr:unnamed protein product [Bursaphelenchus xylophilus]CAG9118168.1 unnamed protein product [Bursaphelenchus xylophilus]
MTTDIAASATQKSARIQRNCGGSWRPSVSKRTLIIVLCLLLSTHGLASAETVRICGEKLIKKVQALCTFIVDGATHVCFKSMKNHVSRRHIFLEHGHHRLNKRSGIADDCCVNRCTIEHMKRVCCDDEELDKYVKQRLERR